MLTTCPGCGRMYYEGTRELVQSPTAQALETRQWNLSELLLLAADRLEAFSESLWGRAAIANNNLIEELRAAAHRRY